MADDQLTDEEAELLRKHRAAKAKQSRKVTVKGRHEDSGAEYSFDLEGDDAERVIARHRSLFEEPEEGGETSDAKSGGKGLYFKGGKQDGK